MNDIEQILKATIQAKVIEAFNDTPQMIEKLVQAALSAEVNQHGSTKIDYRDQKMPYMDYLVGKEIRNATHEAVKDYISNHTDEIRKRVRECIESGEYGKSLADSITNILSQEYNWTVNLNMERYDRD